MPRPGQQKLLEDQAKAAGAKKPAPTGQAAALIEQQKAAKKPAPKKGAKK